MVPLGPALPGVEAERGIARGSSRPFIGACLMMTMQCSQDDKESHLLIRIGELNYSSLHTRYECFFFEYLLRLVLRPNIEARRGSLVINMIEKIFSIFSFKLT